MIIGVDTGGTFTDFVYKEGDTWGVYKVLSTPANPAEAVLNGLDHLAHGKRKQIIHGSTVATNAILERNGAKTALITNEGFEDIIFRSEIRNPGKNTSDGRRTYTSEYPKG